MTGWSTTMNLKRLVIGAAAALLLAPAFGRAQQSPCASPGCEHACSIEYQKRIDACGAASQDAACFDRAALAYRSCLAICPK